MKKQQNRKLALAKETLLKLQTLNDLETVVGGASGRDSCTCYTATAQDWVTYWGPPC